jgi:hypothetical protein
VCIAAPVGPPRSPESVVEETEPIGLRQGPAGWWSSTRNSDGDAGDADADGDGDSDVGVVVAVVAAKGTNEFGKFISRGVVRRRKFSEGGAAIGFEMTLARRYVGDTDLRWRTEPSSANGDLVDVSDMAPWLSISAKPPRKTAKRKTTDDTSGGGAAKSKLKGDGSEASVAAHPSDAQQEICEK